MKRFIALTAVGLLLGTAAYASSVHLKPPHRNPTFIDHGEPDTLEAVGDLAGLGEGNIVVSLEATADVTASCINPGTGEHRPPGQNPAPITVRGAEAIPESEIKNGNVSFDVETEAPESPIPEAPDCPNTNWTETIDDLAFTEATITVEQPEGTVVLTVVCTFDPPTANGAVPAGTVTCTADGAPV